MSEMLDNLFRRERVDICFFPLETKYGCTHAEIDDWNLVSHEVNYSNPLVRISNRLDLSGLPADRHTIPNPGRGDCVYYSVVQGLKSIGIYYIDLMIRHQSVVITMFCVMTPPWVGVATNSNLSIKYTSNV
jgi:hypothetical protein